MIKKLLLLIALVVAPIPGVAQQSLDFDAVGETVPGEGSGGRDAQLTFNWKAQVKIGRLLGEPVVSTRFRYDLLGGTVTLPSSTARGGSRYETHSLTSLPKDAWQRIALYDVKLRLDFRGNIEDFYLITDVGLPGASGEWSFNVPGSPSWKELFIRGSARADGPVYLDAARAKREVSQGLSLVSGYIVEAHLSLFDLHQWYNSENPDYYIDAYGKAIRKLEDGMRISYGINQQTYEDGETVFGRTVIDRLEAANYYKRRLDRLMDIPDRFRIGNNHEPYRVARSQARAIMSGARSEQPTFSSDQTRLPGARKQGRAMDTSPSARRTSSVTDRGDEIPLNACFVRLSQPCARPYSSEIENAMIVDFHMDDVPSDICDNGLQVINYYKNAGGYHISQGFPKDHIGMAKSMINSFSNRIATSHPECRVERLPPMLTVSPPGEGESGRRCYVESRNFNYATAICADF